MFFTPYVPLAGSSDSADALGFNGLSAKLADLLFPQFTVTTRRPAYHGFLCFALNYLKKNGYAGDSWSPEARIRDLEIFWVAHSKHLKGENILNGDKFTDLGILSKKGLTLNRAQEDDLFYKDLVYGTYGHYAVPSQTWGLLETDRNLTELGEELAEAWEARGGGRNQFVPLLNKWMEGNQPLPDSPNKKLRPYLASEDPSDREREVWREIIDETIQENPVSGLLWKKPIKKDTLKLADSEENYCSFFDEVHNHYENYGPEPTRRELQQRLNLCQHFEAIGALAQYVFERAYLRPDNWKPTPKDRVLQEKIWEALMGALKKFNSITCRDKPAWALPETLEGCSSSDLEAKIIEHHAAYQFQKGAEPFMEGNTVKLEGQVKKKTGSRLTVEVLSEKLNALAEKGGADLVERIKRAAAWHYRRNWYFPKAQAWREYAGRV